MNCRPGDMAFVVQRFRNNIARPGEVVRCLELLDGAVWHVEFRGQTHDARGNPWRSRDSSLRPLRDPGNEAVDEIVELVGSPLEIAA